MDIRVLRYFLTIARAGSFSGAAKALYLSQPTLSRQIRELEEELGAELFIRTNHAVTLTAEGLRLQKRAQELVDLMDRTKEEFAHLEGEVAGEIALGCGETQIMREIAKVAIRLRRAHPDIRFNLYSANANDVAEKLDKGLIDFGLIFEPFDTRRYETLRLPYGDALGFLMLEEHPLAKNDAIRMEELGDTPLLLPSQGQPFALWDSYDETRLNVVARYNLLFNAAVMVEQGLGVALCHDHLADTTEHTGLTFRPLDPPAVNTPRLAWKKAGILSPAAELFLQALKESFAL